MKSRARQRLPKPRRKLPLNGIIWLHKNGYGTRRLPKGSPSFFYYYSRSNQVFFNDHKRPCAWWKERVGWRVADPPPTDDDEDDGRVDVLSCGEEAAAFAFENREWAWQELREPKGPATGRTYQLPRVTATFW